MVVCKALYTFHCSPGKGKGILLKMFFFSLYRGIMSESSGMPTQAYQPFLYQTQEGLVRLSSLFRLYVGDGAQYLSYLLNYLICPVCLSTLYIHLYLSFYQAHFFFSGLVSKSQAKYWLLCSSLPFFCNIPATKQKLS